MRTNQGCGEIWGSKSESIRLRQVRNRIVHGSELDMMAKCVMGGRPLTSIRRGQANCNGSVCLSWAGCGIVRGEEVRTDHIGTSIRRSSGVDLKARRACMQAQVPLRSGRASSGSTLDPSLSSLTPPKDYAMMKEARLLRSVS